MPDFLPAVELAAKAVRGTLAYIGAAIDCGLPMRISQSSPAASAAAETSPEAVSARTESAAPASGYPVGPHGDDRPVGGCYFCGQPTANVLATDYDDGEFVCPPCADLTTSAAAPPAAVDDAAEGVPPAPSAAFGATCIVCFRPIGNCDDCADRLFGPPPTRSAAVELPASVPADESPSAEEWRDLLACHPGESSTPEFDWVTWAIPAITDVLAEHRPIGGQFQDGVAEPIFCVDFTRRHRMCADWQGWRDHVAPFIAVAIQTVSLITTDDDASQDRPRPLADSPRYQNPRK